MWMVGYNIAIGLYVLDKWSVLCIPFSDHHKDCTYWTCGQCYVLCMWEVCSNIVIGLSILDMWSVLFVMSVGRMF